MEEEEHYAQKTSQIREFYQNRPPTTVSFNLYLYSVLQLPFQTTRIYCPTV